MKKMIEKDENLIEIEGKLIEIQYKPQSTFGYVFLENQEGKFKIMVHHKYIQKIMENGEIGSQIKLETLEVFFQKY